MDTCKLESKETKRSERARGNDNNSVMREKKKGGANIRVRGKRTNERREDWRYSNDEQRK